MDDDDDGDDDDDDITTIMQTMTIGPISWYMPR